MDLVPSPRIPPAELVQLVGEHMRNRGNLFGAIFGTSPMPPITTVALLCLRRAGFHVQMTTRKAHAYRNEEDNLFSNVLWKTADEDEGLRPLLSRLQDQWPEERKQGLTTITVYALHATQGDASWILDGWAHTDETDILQHATQALDRSATGYIEPWQAAHHEKLEEVLQALDQQPLIDEIMPCLHARLLQDDTVSAQGAPSRRRI